MWHWFSVLQKVQLGGDQLHCSPGWLWWSSCCLTAVCRSVWNELVVLLHCLGDRSAVARSVPFLARRRCAVSWRDGVGWAGDCGVLWLRRRRRVHLELLHMPKQGGRKTFWFAQGSSRSIRVDLTDFLEPMPELAPPGAEDEAFCWRGGVQMAVGMGSLPPGLWGILQCLANKKEKAALPALRYVTQLETGAYKMHLRDPSSSPWD